MKHGKLFRRFKYIITGLASINLILLFVFHYELPSFIKYKLNEKEFKQATQKDLTQQDNLIIQFNPEKLTYKGKGDLNLTKGVVVTKDTGIEVKANLYCEIQKGKSKREKIITYIAEDSYGNTGTANRPLVLKGYDGPSISIDNNMPTIDDTELEYVTTIFTEYNALSAADGYDNDITSSIESTYTITDETASQIEITFSITNMFGDTASKSVKMPLQRTRPLITLTKDFETLPLGSIFTPQSYIASATDKDGNDISTAVQTEGTVDTSTPGTYRITYKLTDANDIEAKPVSLKITVN